MPVSLDHVDYLTARVGSTRSEGAVLVRLALGGNIQGEQALAAWRDESRKAGLRISLLGAYLEAYAR